MYRKFAKSRALCSSFVLLFVLSLLLLFYANFGLRTLIVCLIDRYSKAKPAMKPSIAAVLTPLPTPKNDSAARTPECVKANAQPSFTICIHNTTEDIFVSGSIKGAGMWEGNVHSLLKKFFKAYPNATFLDAGANLGIHALAAAAMGVKVLAIEPTPKHLALLERSIALNKFEDRITLIPYILSDKRANYSMRIDRRNAGHSFIVAHSSGAAFQASSITVDNLIPHIHSTTVIVKLDVEGHECVIVRSDQMKNFLQRFHVPQILLEHAFVDPLLNGASCPEDMRVTLEQLGYQPYLLQGMKRTNFRTLSVSNGKLYDVLWTKDASVAL